MLSSLSIKYFGRNDVEYGKDKGCKVSQPRGCSQSQGAAVGSGAGGDPAQALFHSDRSRNPAWRAEPAGWVNAEGGAVNTTSQAPSSKLQRNPKFQVPITVLPALAVARSAGLESSESAGVRASNIQQSQQSNIGHRTAHQSLSLIAHRQHPTIQSSNNPIIR